MINILLTQKPCYISVDVTGHAGYAEEGKDIVCASVSILVQAAAQAIDDMYERGWLEAEPEIILEKGRSSVTARAKEECRGWMLLGIYAVISGFRLLSAGYPDFVKFSVIGEEESQT